MPGQRGTQAGRQTYLQVLSSHVWSDAKAGYLLLNDIVQAYTCRMAGWPPQLSLRDNRSLDFDGLLQARLAAMGRVYSWKAVLKSLCRDLFQSGGSTTVKHAGRYQSRFITTTIGEFKDYLSGLDLPNPFAGLASAGQAVMDAIGGIGNAASGGGADGDPSTPMAGGTSYWSGGLVQKNERGYEQIVLPAGSRIYTNGQTNNLPAGGGTTINVNLGGVSISKEMDVQTIGYTLANQIAAAMG